METEALIARLSRQSAAYRWTLTLLLSFVTMKAAFDIFILNLATASVPFHCAEAVVDNVTVPWSSLNATNVVGNFTMAAYQCLAPQFASTGSGLLQQLPGNSSCSSWTFVPEAGDESRRNMLMEFQFVCDRQYLADRMQTIMQAGIFVSCSFAPLADLLGRKLPIIVFVYIDLVSTVFVIFVTDLRLQMALRFFMGFGSPAVLTSMAYLTELISEDFHSIHGNFYWTLWVVGYAASGALAYCVTSWRLQMVVVVCIIGSAYATYGWVLVESPLWLAARGKRSELKAALLKLFRRHGLDTREVEQLQTSPDKASSSCDSSAMSACADFLPKESLCQRKYISVQLVFTTLFVANAMSYFSSSFRRDFITQNPYLNVGISGLIEFPAAVVGWLLTERCGRKLSNLLLLLPAGVLLAATPFVPQAPSVTFGARSLCALVSKFLITVSFNIVLIFGSESLPTTIRATSFVIASQAMRLGQMLTPELTTALAEVAPSFPNIFYGGFCLASGLLILFVQETHHQKMPASIAEMRGLRAPCARRRVIGNYALDAVHVSNQAVHEAAPEASSHDV